MVTDFPVRAIGSSTSALERFAIIFTTFSFLLIVMKVLVFFCGRRTLPDSFKGTLARLVLVSAGASALIMTHLLRIYTETFRRTPN